MTIQDEFEFIQKIKPKKLHQSSIITAIGDDAALFSGNSEVEEIVCMDTMVEEVHFSRKTMSPFAIGYRTLASNLSDIAAMGGIPTYYLVSIAIPKSWSESELIEIYKGMDSLASTYTIDLIGGDTVSTKQSLVITITVLGRIEKGRHLLRSKAMKGDIIFVTGTLGDSAAGLEILLDSGYSNQNVSEDEKYLIQRHQFPAPRIEVGRILSSYDRVALNDISDGISSEAKEIADASDVSLIIDKDKLPRSKALQKFTEDRQFNWILFGGEDYELVGTIPKKDWIPLKEKCEQNGTQVFEIGYVDQGPSSVLLRDGLKINELDKKGFNHFT